MTICGVTEHLGNQRTSRDLGESSTAGYLQEATGHVRAFGWDSETTTRAALNSQVSTLGHVMPGRAESTRTGVAPP